MSRRRMMELWQNGVILTDQFAVSGHTCIAAAIA